jgi:hypothetical protein
MNRLRAISETRTPGTTDTSTPRQTDRDRGKYFTLRQVVEAYPALTPRLVRRLVQQRRISFSKVGRVIVLAEADIEAYIEAHRIEPPDRKPTGIDTRSCRCDIAMKTLNLEPASEEQHGVRP